MLDGSGTEPSISYRWTRESQQNQQQEHAMKKRKSPTTIDEGQKRPLANDGDLTNALDALFATLANATDAPWIVVIAGPNGAGKSTLTRNVVSERGLDVIDPDRIAVAISLDQTEMRDRLAQRLTEEVRRAFVADLRTFAFETVLSDPEGAKVRELQELQRGGYRIALIYVGLSSAQLSTGRVLKRIMEKGHAVDPSKLGRRYEASLVNAVALRRFADVTLIVDNSSSERPHRFIALMMPDKVFAKDAAIPAWALPFFERDD